MLCCIVLYCIVFCVELFESPISIPVGCFCLRDWGTWGGLLTGSEGEEKKKS